MQVHVLPVAWTEQADKLREVRTTVFIDEQRVPQEIEWDGLDEDAHHFLALNEAGQVLGCARLLETGQIGRMAVLASHRGRGIGERLLAAAVAHAKSLGMRRVFLHAQTQAAGFYRKAGFLPEGGEFMEAGIPHVNMALKLPIPFEPPETPPAPVIRAEVPEEPLPPQQLEPFDGEAASLNALLTALRQPGRTLRLYSQLLDPVLFDREEVADAISEFARRGPPVSVQILIHSSSLIVARGHRLLELARRLDSKIEIRRVPTEHADDEHTFVGWDERGYWLMPDHQEYQSYLTLYDPVRAAKLAERFGYLWERSAPDPELRVLRI
jgi:predicted GNAT family N-acyltransferase